VRNKHLSRYIITGFNYVIKQILIQVIFDININPRVRKKKLKDIIIVVIQSHLKRDLDFRFLAININT
jgi:hypothetical protein